jgi:hypothetical protein
VRIVYRHTTQCKGKNNLGRFLSPDTAVLTSNQMRKQRENNVCAGLNRVCFSARRIGLPPQWGVGSIIDLAEKRIQLFALPALPYELNFRNKK